MAEGEWITGKVEMGVRGIPVEFEVTVPVSPVKPHRMLPIFQQMANSFVDLGVEAAKMQGRTVSCKAGCGACCRQPVPISETEVYRIAEIVEELPEPKRTQVKEKFAAAAGHFNDIGWFERFREYSATARHKDPDDAVREGRDIVLEYFYEGVACPFLEDESCSIHKERPVVCREYLVTTPSENCSAPSPENIRLVELLIKPSRALRRVASTGRLDRFGPPILARALEMAAAEPEAFRERSGPEWMQEFMKELTDQEIPLPSE